MKKTISKSNFAQEFENYGRGDQFSHEALDAIFDYLEDADPDLELDVIGVCCDFSEYDSAIKAAEDCGFDKPEREDGETDDEYEDRIEEEARDWLEKKTTVLDAGCGSVVIINF